MKRRLASLLALSCAVPLLAEQLPSRTRGLSADSVYQVGDLDNVNLFNGNLTLTIPIGQSYPVSPQLSYRLTLVYNSSVWDFEDDLSCLQDNQRRYYHFPYLNPSSNAGVGWSLHFGRLFEKNDPLYNKNNGSWLFVGPDGSQHNFYERLHPTEPTVANVFYTLDGTYLRLDLRGASPKIESPDGLVRTFSLADGRYRLTEIADRFGNWMRVAYGATSWTITDSHGRNHVLTLNEDGQVIDADLDAFGTVSTAGNAHYDFGYTSASIDRHRFNREPCDFNREHTETEDALLLTSLGLPDGTGYGFTYSKDDSTSTSFSGAIRSAALPTGGRIEWDYATYGFKSQAPTVQESVKTQQRGVGARRTYLVDDKGDHLQGSWDYDYTEGYQVTPPSGPFQVSCWHRMRVSDDVSKTVTESYFATAGGADNWWYGLPYAPCDPVTSSTIFTQWSPGNGAPHLSTRVLERQSDGSLKAIRSTYVIYDSDGRDSGPRQDRNHRLRYQKVVYHDDDPDGSGNAHWEATASSDFDGLGHYRSVSRSSSFGSTKAVATAYLPAGSYQLNPDTGAVLTDTFAVPSVSAPWLGGLSSGSTTTQGSGISKRETCFDTATGALLRQRQLAGTSQAGRDLVVDFEIDEDADGNRGFVVAERLYGGDDLQNSPAGSLCGLNLGAQTPAFVKRSSYQYGSVTRSAWVEPCHEGTEVLVEAEATVDQWTGLARAVVETGGIGVGLKYDEMGRLLAEVPDEGASRVHQYLPGGPTPSYEVNHCPEGEDGFCGPGSRLDNRFWEYDGLGRLARKSLAFPATGGGDATPSVTYGLDGLGRKTSESTWGGAHSTAYDEFDVFGRARSIAPEGSYATQLTFAGARIKSRQVMIATGQGPPESVYATELSDHLGRLVAVCDGATAIWNGQGTCPGQLTRYSYDQDDRLVQVCQNVSSSGSCGQQRFFSWDGRGFLLAESHPEIGAGGNGTITYQRDARGNPTARDVANDTGDRPLRYTYDRAGRTIRVEEQAAIAGWRVIKEFFYARENRPGSSEKRRGQLVMARRTNWVALLDPLPSLEGTAPLVVTDHYEYFGLGGRVSKKTTSISLPSGSQSFSTFFTYDPLGNVASILYPSGDWPYQNAPARQVSWERRLGFTTGIPGFADEIHYQLGGMLHEIEYPNGTTWRQTAEAATGWERPDNIQTLTGSGAQLWSTGDYDYDGAGNVTAIGDRTYVYDRFSRFTYVQRTGQPQREQQATYDAYGNLTALARSGSIRVLTTNAATNRLATPDTAYTSNGELADVKIDGTHFVYGYDGLGQQLFQQTPTKTWVYAYDASDERILSWECAGDRCGERTNFERYTLRSLGGEVLRVFEGPSRPQLEWKEDYVYRDGQPLAWVKALDEGGEQKLFLHADHLGSTRLVTNTAGQQISRHDFLPFGEESTTSTSGDIALKFTGHERDQPGKPMDYMHARSVSPLLGRFLRVDPSGASAKSSSPQSWNRYTYAANNPLANHDPDGLECRAAILLEQDIQDLAAGRISIDTYHERIHARAEGALFALSIYTPGPEELVLASAFKLTRRFIGKLGDVAGTVLRGIDRKLADRALERAVLKGIDKGCLAGSCATVTKRVLDLVPGSRMISTAPTQQAHFAALLPDGRVFDATLRDNLIAYGAKVDDLPVGSYFTREEWDVFAARFPSLLKN